MRPLLRSEALKLRTKPGARALLVAAAGLSFAALFEFLAFSDVAHDADRDAISNLGLGGLLALVHGIVSVTSEFRHGTIGETIALEPRRRRALAAKGTVAVAAAAAVGAAVYAVGIPLALLWISLRGSDPSESAGSLALTGLCGTLAFALWAAVGVGIGALVRDQTVAVTGALLALLVADPLVAALAPSVGAFGPTAAAASLTGVATLDDPLPRLAAGLVMALYATAAYALGSAALARRDVG